MLLLEGLVKSDIKFVFKGGTALMLLMGSTKRLSIDIDIISTPQELEKLFEIFLKEQGFNRFELQERSTASNIEKAHYKFFYTPIHKCNKIEEDYVLLDILFEEPHYAKVISWPIDSTFLQQEGEPLAVNVPNYEDILGDKLTAFAPNTSGIP